MSQDPIHQFKGQSPIRIRQHDIFDCGIKDVIGEGLGSENDLQDSASQFSRV
jgi:hypothetical protein